MEGRGTRTRAVDFKLLMIGSPKQENDGAVSSARLILQPVEVRPEGERLKAGSHAWDYCNDVGTRG